MKINSTEIVKLIVKALRHDPDSLGLDLDEGGWVQIADIIEGFNLSTPYSLDEDEVLEAIHTSNRKRLEIKDSVIRASAGHTTDHFDYPVTEPPNDLFYLAVPENSLDYIEESGIKARGRKYLEIFQDYREAEKDAKKRRLKHPVYLKINAMTAYHDGTVFYCFDNRWYVDAIDSFHIEIPDDNRDLD